MAKKLGILDVRILRISKERPPKKAVCGENDRWERNIVVRLDELFNEHRGQLSENDLYIWKYISAHRRKCAEMSIETLGRTCNVSRTTVLRFTQKLGLHGFSEFKTLLRMEDEPNTSADFIGQTCAAYHAMMENIQHKDCTELFRRIDQAENLYVFSSGMLQDAVGRELRRMFLAGNKWFYLIQAGTEADVLLNNVSDRDLVLILSVSGESPHVLQMARALKARSVPIVSITKQRENTLAQLCGYRLYISTVDLRDSGISYQSTTSFFILVELLFLKYIQYKKVTNVLETRDPD